MKRPGTGGRGQGRQPAAAPIVPEPAAPFQVRAVDTTPEASGGFPARAFQVRDAATVTLPPPHWAKYQGAAAPGKEE